MRHGSGRQRRVDGVVDVLLIDRRVDLVALADDALEVRGQLIADDLVDLAVVERRQQAAREPLGPAAAAGERRNRLERRLDAVRAEADRARESGFSIRNSAMRIGRRSAV